MLDVPEAVWDALGDTHVRRRLWGLAQYQGRQVQLQLDTSGDVSFSSSKGVQSDASIRVVGLGDSLVPRTMTDMLAPYGQEVSLFWEVLLRGDVTYTIPMGVFRISGNDGGRESLSSPVRTLPGNAGAPGTIEVDGDGLIVPSGELAVDGEFLDIGGFPTDGDGFYVGTRARAPRRVRVRQGVLDWEIGVDLVDRFHMLERGKLVDPKSPQTTSMWAELQRLSLFPLLQSGPDAVVPRSMAYDERLSAVWDLAALAGAVPAITRHGALTLRPQDRWLTETVPDFDLSGTITFSRGQSDEFYNFVWAHSDDNRFSAFEALLDDSDPRSVGRAGPVTYEHSSPAYTSNAAARAGARTILNRLLNRRSVTVSAVCGPQAMLLEVGDFGWVRDPASGRAALGEVSSIVVPNDPTAPVDVELIVAEES